MKKGKIVMTITIGLVCFVLALVMSMQFKVVRETDITSIETMRETELKEELSSWKEKYKEVNQKYEEINQKVEEYKEKKQSDSETSELLQSELQQLNMGLGKTDVQGEGIIVTLTDTDDLKINDNNLLIIVNDLKLAGAEAVSINDERIVNMTDIAYIGNTFVKVNGQRISSPYVIKAIGNQTYLSSTLSLKDSGYIDKAKAVGLNVKLETGKNIKISKYSGEMEIKYMKEGANQQ